MAGLLLALAIAGAFASSPAARGGARGADEPTITADHMALSQFSLDDDGDRAASSPRGRVAW